LADAPVTGLPSLPISLPDGLCIHVDGPSAYVLPVLGGRPRHSHCVRIPLALDEARAFLQSALSLRFPVLAPYLTDGVAERLLLELCRMPLDYAAESRAIADEEARISTATSSDDPISTPAADSHLGASPVWIRALPPLPRDASSDELARKAEQRKKAGERLAALSRARAAEKKALQAENSEEPAERAADELLATPDEELSDHSLNRKRAFERARITGAARDASRQAFEARELWKRDHAAEFVSELEARRAAIDAELAALARSSRTAGRRSQASAQRMELLAAATSDAPLGDFGEDEEDWDAYAAMRLDGAVATSADLEAEKRALLVEMAKWDPNFAENEARRVAQLRPQLATLAMLAGWALPVHVDSSGDKFPVIGLSVILLTAGEILWRPSAGGFNASVPGLLCALENCLAQFEESDRARLGHHVCISGPGALFTGFAARVNAELVRLLPPGAAPEILVAPTDSVWRGAAWLARWAAGADSDDVDARFVFSTAAEARRMSFVPHLLSNESL
jgi:hypothetical protein